MTWLESLLRRELDDRLLKITRISIRTRFELYFLQGRSRYLVKVPRDQSQSKAMLACEHSQLVALVEACPIEWLSSVPYPVRANFDSGYRQLWIQSVLPGLQPQPHCIPPRLNELVCNWLAELAVYTLSPARLSPARLLAELRMELPLPVRESLLEALVGQLPGVVGHNDLNLTNLLIDKEKLGVVDWVMSERNQIPLFDWFCYCTYRTMGSQRTLREGFKQALSAFSQPETLISNGAYSILDKCELPRRLFKPLRKLFLVTRFHNLARWREFDFEVDIKRQLHA